MKKTKKRKARIFYVIKFGTEPAFAFATKKLAVTHWRTWFADGELIKVREVLKGEK